MKGIIFSVILLTSCVIAAQDSASLRRLTLLRPVGSYTPFQYSPSFSVRIPLPKIETAKGAVFCRMEDYMTRTTKIWFRVGVR